MDVIYTQLGHSKLSNAHCKMCFTSKPTPCAVSCFTKVFSYITSADDISLLEEVVTFMLLDKYASRKLPKCRGKIG